MKYAVAFLIVVVVLAAVSLFPVQRTENPTFASPAFQRAWNAETASAARSIDIWGGEPLLWRVETYHGAPNDRRTVQYFERGRMEMQPGSSLVTHGRLAKELTTGRIDLGEGLEVERQAPELSIDSGVLDERIPTYLSLSRLVSSRSDDRSSSGQHVVDWIDRSGRTSETGGVPEVIRLTEYVEETGHNLPEVTTTLFNQPELRNDDWIEAFGYPISEPYWTYFRRDQERSAALVQVFERRILIYSPEVEAGPRFTVSSTGRHYYTWRYGSSPEQSTARLPEQAASGDLTLADGYSAYTYAEGVGVPVDMALSPTGHLLILTREGRILRPRTTDPDAFPGEFITWAEGIENPLGLVTRNESVMVSTESGVRWYSEQNGVGALDEMYLLGGTNLISGRPFGRPVADAEGHIYGYLDNGPGSSVLLDEGTNEPLLHLDQLFADAGPVQFLEQELYLTGRNEDSRSSVLALSIDDELSDRADPDVLASFPEGTTALSMAAADEPRWPVTNLGTLFVALHDGTDASIFGLATTRTREMSEAVELAGGFSRPVAMVFGLDGSLYVADADRGDITRILPDAVR